MKKQISYFGLTAIAVALCAVSVKAEVVDYQPMGAYGGLTLGYGAVSGDTVGGRTSWGFNGGYQLDEDFSVGGYFSYGSKDSIGLSHYGVEGSWHANKYVYAGLKMGSTRVSVPLVGILSVAVDSFSFGPHVGVNYPLGKKFAAGAEINYMRVAGSTDENLDAFGVFNTQASFKYLF